MAPPPAAPLGASIFLSAPRERRRRFVLLDVCGSRSRRRRRRLRFLAERRLRARHGRDDLALVGHGRPRRDHRRPEVRLERERRARDERELHVLPVLARQVLHDAPRLEIGVALGVDDQPVRRSPHRRLGHVPDLQLVGLAVERQQDRLEPVSLVSLLLVGRPSLGGRRRESGLSGPPWPPLAGVVGARGLVALVVRQRKRRRTNGAAPALHHRERREKVTHLRALHLEAHLAAVDVARSLEVRDPVAIHDDARHGERVGRGDRLPPASSAKRTEHKHPERRRDLRTHELNLRGCAAFDLRLGSRPS